MIDINKLKLTDMNDFRLIPQLVEEVATRYDKEQEKYIYKMLHDLKIDKDILKNQVQEINRLNDILREYKELEEQGLLLKLPCKIGDTVYVIEDVYGKGEFEITEYQVECMRTGDNFSMTFDALEHDECLEVTFETMDIGRTVFLSYAEAEQALKRLEGAE
jgi:hypothetical protein